MLATRSLSIITIVLPLALIACAPSGDFSEPTNEELSTYEQAVVGGRAEGGFPAIGHLLSGPSNAPAAAFSDVSCHWAQNLIEPLAGLGLVADYPDGTFRPYGKITRAEFASLLATALQPAPTRAPATFRDVPGDAWFAKAVGAVQRAGFMSGDPDGTFRPSASITRIEMIVALSSGSQLPLPREPVAQTLNVFEDANGIPTWARIQVASAMSAGIVTAYPNLRRFDGDSPARRAEAVASVHQALVLLGRTPAVENDFVVRPYR